MRPKFSLPLLLVSLLLFTTSLQAQNTLEALAQQAVSNDKKKSAVAVSELRKFGPAGLEAMFATHSAAINKQICGASDTNNIGMGSPKCRH